MITAPGELGSSASNMFDGFRSRWISPAAWMAPSASATPAPSTLTLSRGRAWYSRENLPKRRSGDIGGHHPGPLGVRVGVDNLRGVESADLAASLYLQPEPPPELDVIGESGIDQLDRDRAPGPRPAEEHLAHPARPKTTGQNIVPDSPWVSWPEGIHATPSPQGNSGRGGPARTR